MGNEVDMDITSLGQTYLKYRETRWGSVKQTDRLDSVEQVRVERERVIKIVSETVDPLIKKISTVNVDEVVLLYFIQKYLGEFLSDDQSETLRKHREELREKFPDLGRLENFITRLQSILTSFFNSSGQLFQRKEHTVSLQLPGVNKSVRELITIECQRISLDLTKHASSGERKPELRFTIDETLNILELHMKK